MSVALWRARVNRAVEYDESSAGAFARQHSLTAENIYLGEGLEVSATARTMKQRPHQISKEAVAVQLYSTTSHRIGDSRCTEFPPLYSDKYRTDDDEFKMVSAGYDAMLNAMLNGRVRTKTTKRASRVLIEKYYPRLTLDFHTNKRIIDEVAVVPSKRLRNKISGFTTHLMKRIQKGPVRGISFKLQEEERERKDNYVPEVSALDTTATGLEVDPQTKELLLALNFESIAVNVIQPVVAVPERGPRRERRNVPGAGRS
ncbi:hypothetical protein DXG03_007586 [Asterophora parasitica]|uniref:40S ribosomal protein S17 n=1 Tax=Asterophora parasitica TaxID=117018 RepID=A0A9P7G7X6_9AGAR|nr:hypothetical protein DXG03_007586 [Asterophora parasitica]